MDNGETFVTLASVARTTDNNQFVWFITKNGLIKKTNLNEYTGMKRKGGIIATSLREGDSLAKVFIAPNSQIMIFTKDGMSLRFDGSTIGATSRVSTGVKAITLNKDDSVADALYLSGEKEIMIFSKMGLAKRIPVKEFVLQNRAGKGLICYKNIEVAKACPVNEDHMILVVGNKTSICINVTDVSIGSRASQGVLAIKDNEIIGVARIN